MLAQRYQPKNEAEPIAKTIDIRWTPSAGGPSQVVKSAKLVAFGKGGQRSSIEIGTSPRRVSYYVQASPQLNFAGGLRGRLGGECLIHESKCGCRAAHASIAQEMPRSSCCPGGQV
jgi:hypothetical protein